MTDQELQEIRERLNKSPLFLGNIANRPDLKAPLDFYANARADIERLLAEVDRLKEWRENLVKRNREAIADADKLIRENESLRRDREELIKVLSSILFKGVDGRDFEDLMNETLEFLQHKYGGFKNSRAINMVLEFRESAREVLSRIQGREGK